MSSPQEDNVVELASRERSGRRQLVERLFESHARALRLFLLGRSVPRDEIDGLVQELFTRLMGVEGLEEKMSDATGSSRSYLLTMANNMIVDKQRKLRVRNAYAAAQLEIERERMDVHSPERIVAAQLELEAIRSVILKMRSNWKVAFVLQRFHNMSYEEIASYMGVTRKQAGHYIVRAMRQIRKERQKIMAAGGDWC